MMALTANQVESLPPFVAAVLSECPEPLTRGADQPVRQERRQHQRQSAVVSHRRPGPQGRCSAANKQRTLSDAQAIRQGTVAGTDGSGTPTPFWVEAGMRTAINRLCSVVLHAVGTGQLDLLHKCEASADQLQAHFRIPPWQMSAVHRHVTTGIWLLTNSGTNGLTPDQVKDHGNPSEIQTPPTRSVVDPQEWQPLPCCSDVDVPGEAGEVWTIGAVHAGLDPYMEAARADAGASRQRKSRRAWDLDPSTNHAARELRKSRSRSGSGSKRSRRGNPTSDIVHGKSRRRHRRAGRRETEPMQVMWPMNFHDDTFQLDGSRYVNGPPEPEQQQNLQDQHDQKLFTLLDEEQFVVSNGVGQASRGEITVSQVDTQIMCCDSGSGVPGAEPQTASYSHRSTASPTTGVWPDISAATETAIASRTSSNGNSQLGGSEDPLSLLIQKMPAAYSSTHTYIQTNSQNSGDSDHPAEEPTCGSRLAGMPGLAVHPMWSPDMDGPMTITAAASHKDQAEQCSFDPFVSYKIYHPRQDDSALQTKEYHRRSRSVPWTNFHNTRSGNGDRNSTTKLTAAEFDFAAFQSSAVAVPLTSGPPPPPPAVPPPPPPALSLHRSQDLQGASLVSPVFQQVESPQGPTIGWIEEQQPQQHQQHEVCWDLLSPSVSSPNSRPNVPVAVSME